MFFQAVCRKCEQKFADLGIQELKDGSKILAIKQKCKCDHPIIWVEIK